jgi:hypothetical protein
MSYCMASIMMTVVNKFVVSGRQFSMTFLRERASLILITARLTGVMPSPHHSVRCLRAVRPRRQVDRLDHL